MSNQAAWINEAKSTLQVGPAPMYTPTPDEVVIQIRAVAINPMDEFNQKTGYLVGEYPAILGSDGAGEVYAVGSDVQGFKVGDRVTAAFDGIPPFPKANYHRSSFQKFAVAKASLTAKIPDSISFIDASVLPLCITSAADGLFSDHGMELAMPQLGQPKPNGQAVVVWAASSSVGTCAIQLLVAAGYEVAAVAGSRNHALCRSLGAKHVFDHASTTVVEDIASILKDKEIAGVFTTVMVKEALDKVVKTFVSLGKKGKLGSVFPPGAPVPSEVPEGIEITRTHGSYMVTSEVGQHIWGKWLPKALQEGTVKCVPMPVVFGKGLEQVQGAIDRYGEGVSGQKVVVDLS